MNTLQQRIIAMVMTTMLSGPALAQADLPLEDRLQIMELASRHNFAIDEMNVQAYGQVYAPDAVLVGPNGTLVGREAIEQGLIDYQPYAAGNRHHTLNHVITANPDGTASMTSYFLTVKVESETPSREVPYTLSSAMHRDQLEKIDGRWMIRSRQQVDVSTREQPW